MIRLEVEDYCSNCPEFCPDNSMTITVYGKRADHIIIGANWSEENIKDCIKDTIRRACYD